jgi:hypothetical protein
LRRNPRREGGDDPEGLRNVARCLGLISYAAEEKGDYATALDHSHKLAELIRRNFAREPSNATLSPRHGVDRAAHLDASSARPGRQRLRSLRSGKRLI